MPPVQPAGDAERHVLEDVQDRVLQRRVVQRGDVPDRHRGDVQHDREDRVGERAGAALDADEAARQRAQQHLREPQQHEDRGEVEQQQVLDHVHEKQLLAEAVDR
jgi:hypothetical protein